MPTRADVDEVFRDMTGAGYRGLPEPYDALWGSRYAIIEGPRWGGCGLDESGVGGQEVAAAGFVIVVRSPMEREVCLKRATATANAGPSTAVLTMKP